MAGVSERWKSSHIPNVDGDSSFYQGLQPNSMIQMKGRNYNTVNNSSMLNSYLEQQDQSNRFEMPAPFSLINIDNTFLRPLHVKGGLSAIDDYYSNFAKAPVTHHHVGDVSKPYL